MRPEAESGVQLAGGATDLSGDRDTTGACVEQNVNRMVQQRSCDTVATVVRMDENVLDDTATGRRSPGAEKPSDVSTALCAIVGRVALKLATVVDGGSGVRGWPGISTMTRVLFEMVQAEHLASDGPSRIALDGPPHRIGRRRPHQ